MLGTCAGFNTSSELVGRPANMFVLAIAPSCAYCLVFGIEHMFLVLDLVGTFVLDRLGDERAFSGSYAFVADVSTCGDG